MAWAEARAGARDETDRAWERLAGFRRELYRCFTARADALSELCDAALCKQDRVHMLAELSLEPGGTSWTRLLDAVRLRPDDDLAAVTAAQVRGVIERIIAAGHWHDGDPDIMVIFDAGYEPARLAWLLQDLPVQVLGRLGTNR